jgi:thiol-disulfide isomerase/thioredoxin
MNITKNQKYMAAAAVVLIILFMYRRSIMSLFGAREGFTDANSPSFTMYYADWCPHCKTSKPVFSDWSKSGSITVNGQPVALAMVEESQKADDAPVKGYPTFIMKKGGQYTEYSGDRSPAGWEAWLKQNL